MYTNIYQPGKMFNYMIFSIIIVYYIIVSKNKMLLKIKSILKVQQHENVIL